MSLSLPRYDDIHPSEKVYPKLFPREGVLFNENDLVELELILNSYIVLLEERMVDCKENQQNYDRRKRDFESAECMISVCNQQLEKIRKL